MTTFRFEDSMTVGGVLRLQAEMRCDVTALVVEDGDGRTRTFAYGELYRRARAAAARLSAAGVTPGGRVHVHLGNRVEFVDCWLGCALLGAVMVPTGLSASPTEVTFVRRHAQCELTITDGAHAHAWSTAAATSTDRWDAPVLGITETDDWLADWPDTFEMGAEGPPVLARDPLAIMYTSGTTSRPKGVVVSHANYVHVGETVAQHLRVTESDRWLVVLPLFHANAQYYSFMSAFVSGASVALMPRFSASRWGAQVQAHEATLASLFAAPIRMILKQEPSGLSPRYSWDKLRLTLFGQNITSGEAERFEATYCTSLLQLYGMTETIAPPLMNSATGPRRHDSIGRPVLGVRVRVDGDADQPDDEAPVEGELLVHGEPGVSLMSGYLDDPAATSAALEGGEWLRTGDRVSVDRDGYFYFVDRLKDMVKKSGENIALSEVERVLDSFPAIAESAVIGEPDEVRDVRIRAFVVPRSDHQLVHGDIVAWCVMHLAKFKVPDEISLVNQLPRTAVGKIEKRTLTNAWVRDNPIHTSTSD